MARDFKELRIRVPSSLYEMMQEYSADAGCSLTSWVNMRMRSMVANWEPDVSKIRSARRGVKDVKKGKTTAEKWHDDHMWGSGFPKVNKDGELIACPTDCGDDRPHDPLDHSHISESDIKAAVDYYVIEGIIEPRVDA